MHQGPSRGGLDFSAHARKMGGVAHSLASNPKTYPAIAIEEDSPTFPQMLLYDRLVHSRLILLEP
jgi:hypothetical protein